jgi:hypothetical protein
MNFVGAGVTASYAGGVLTVTIPGGGGGGGTPSAPFTSVQYNNAGSFGGSANFTWNGTGLVITNGAGITDTLSPGTLLFTTAATGTVSVKTGAGADGPLNLDILDLQVNGSAGTVGQVLTSGGAGASPTWGAIAVGGGWTDGGTTVYLTTSTDVVSVGNNAGVANRKFSVTNTGTDLGMSVLALASTDSAWEAKVVGDAADRIQIITSGNVLWGSGAAAADLRLSRTGTKTLTLDDNAAGSMVLIVKGSTNTQQRIHGAASKVFADSPYTTAATDEMVFWSCTGGNCTQNLPTPVVALGRTLIVKRTDTSANTLTLTPAAGQVEGGASLIIGGGPNRASVTLMSDNANWWII